MPTPRHNRRVRVIEEEPENEEDDLKIYAVTSKHSPEKDWNINVKVEDDKTIKFKIDTGAQCNIMSLETYNSISSQPLKRSGAKLVSFGGHKIKPKGKTQIVCEYKKRLTVVEFEVVEKGQNILGLKSSVDMKLVKRIDTITNSTDTIIAQYEDVFKGLGCITKARHSIRTDPNYRPVIHPPRRVPAALREKVRHELERMENLGVIKRIHMPTKWVNSMVVAIKPNGQLRICLDPRDLNQAILREHYPMPTIEDVLTRIPNAKIFSVLDATSGYWQIELDDESTELCTFNTPFGRYAFKRLPFGISSSQDIFQSVMTDIFSDIKGVEVIVDDILIWARNEEEHNTILRKVLERARQRNLRLNREKSQIKRNSITYIGHTLSSEGIKPDPKKVKAVTMMKTPQSKDELRRFLGMITYLGKFMPNLSQSTEALRHMIEADTEWKWSEEHEKCYNNLKHLATSTPVLQYFNTSKPLTISVDASIQGLGAALMQDNLPVAYASRTLNKSEKRYAQIEKEMLAIVFGCTRFHDYIYGMVDVTVETDHKPLESILKKPLYQAPIRLQKMIMTIQRYNIKVRYRPGKELVIADTLSRAPNNSQPVERHRAPYEDYEINTIFTLPISKYKLRQIQEETDKDQDLKVLQQYIVEGWPDHQSQTLLPAKPYWNYRDELSIEKGIILRGERIVIPQSMHKEMLKRIHNSHLGIGKCQRRAKDLVFWPGMASQIQDMISKCQICCSFQRNNSKQPLIPHTPPTQPWEKVGADLFEINNKTYLLLVDYYSDFIEIDNLTNTTSERIIESCKSQFARHGIPVELITDNGPQFSSIKFKEFAKTYSFQHTTSSPHYPQSNGKAEKAVQIAKNLIKKTTADKQDIYLALLDIRNTPASGGIGSPAQRLMGRRTNTLIPTARSLLQPQIIDPQQVLQHMQQSKRKQKEYYDQHTKDLPTLKIGEKVMIKDQARWKPATIIQIHSNPRSYVVKTSEGNRYRRNRRHIVRNTNKESQNDEDEEEDNYTHIQQEEEQPDEQPTEEDAQTNSQAESQPLRRSKRITARPNRYSDTWTT